MLLGLASATKDGSRLTQRNILSLKKLALSVRILRVFVSQDANALAKVLVAERSGNFEVEVFDAIAAACLFEQSRLAMNPGYQPVLGSKPSEYLQSLSEFIKLGTSREGTLKNTANARSQVSQARLDLAVEEVGIQMLRISEYYN